MIPILVVAGPTASGKTELAIELAQALGGEIISADSRQVYVGLDVGTAKPSREQRARVKHHLIDIVSPRERYNAGRFARDASAVIGALEQEGKAVVLCGGTGLYLEALVNPFFEVPKLPEEEKIRVRRQLSEKASAQGRAALHRELAGIDSQSAARLHPNDFQRISRALELYYLSGRTMTELLSVPGKQRPYAPFTVILNPEREELKESISQRTERMLEGGWVEEVESLLASGTDPGAPGMQSLGYREVIALIRGEISRGGAVDAINRKTWQYARRQRIWFDRKPAQIRAGPKALSAERIVSLWHAHCSSYC